MPSKPPLWGSIQCLIIKLISNAVVQLLNQGKHLKRRCSQPIHAVWAELPKHIVLVLRGAQGRAQPTCTIGTR